MFFIHIIWMSKNSRQIFLNISRKFFAIVLITGIIGAKAYMIETENTQSSIIAASQTGTPQTLLVSAAESAKK